MSIKNDKCIEFNIIGAGLAGSEAAHYIASKGFKVNLYEMRPNKYTDAHKSEHFAELICSNSLKSKHLHTASGVLKQEMSALDSIILKSAFANEIPGGSALTVDREGFSSYVTEQLKSNKNITFINEEVKDLSLFIESGQATIVCVGPLASLDFTNSLSKITSDDNLYFYDAIAPTLLYEDIDFTNAYKASRYDQSDAAYINCPLTKEEYDKFYNFVVNAQTVELRKFESMQLFEACMPFESLAKRGYDALRFGPLKPAGLLNPHTGLRDYAVIQLRQDNFEASLFNMVGFQTNLTYGMQKEMLSFIPALKKSQIVRYGVMHRNTYINAPKFLNKYYQSIQYPNIFFAGQITGVEGYLPSAASGITAAVNSIKYCENKEMVDFTKNTMIGALQNHIVDTTSKKYTPMNANFGIINELEHRVRNKREKYLQYAQRSKEFIYEIINEYDI